MRRVFKALEGATSAAIWVVIGLIVSLLVLMRLSWTQSAMASWTADVLAKQLGTRVEIGRVSLGLAGRVVADSVTLYDLEGEPMIKASRLSAKINIAPLAEGRVVLASAQLFGAQINLYKSAPDAAPNYQFVLDSLASDDSTPSRGIDLRINSLIIRRSSVAYNLRYEPATPGKLNPNHIRATDISAHLTLKALRPDSLNLNVRRISLREQSGLDVRRLALRAEGGRRQMTVDGLALELPHSTVRIDTLRATYDYGGANFDPQTLAYKGAMGPSRVALADIACLLPINNLPEWTIRLGADFSGTASRIDIHRLNAASTDGDALLLDAAGWLAWGGERPAWDADINRLQLSADAVGDVARCVWPDGGTAADVLQRAGRVALSASARSTASRRLTANAELTTDAGTAEATISMDGDGRFDATVRPNSIALATLLDNSDLGMLSADIALQGLLPRKGQPQVSAQGTVESFDYLGYTYKDVALGGSYDQGALSASIDIDDTNAAASVNGTLKRSGRRADVELSANVRRLCPAPLGLSDRWGDAAFSALVAANFAATSINDATGMAEITDFAMRSAADTLLIGRTVVSMGYDGELHHLAMEGDFATAGLTGQFDYATLAQSFTNYIATKLPTIPGLPPVNAATANDFMLTATITDAHCLEALLGVPLQLTKPLTLTAEVDDKSRNIAVDCRAEHFAYDGKDYSGGSLALRTLGDTMRCDAALTRMMADGSRLRMALNAAAADNRLNTSLAWDSDESEAFSGQLNTVAQFYRDETGREVASMAIQPSHVRMKGSQWDVHPSAITYTKQNISIDNFAITNGQQYVKAHGRATADAADSLVVDLNDVDLGYILDLVDFHTVEFDGRASGRAIVKAPFGPFDASARIDVGDFLFEHGRLGTLHAGVDWNAAESQLDIAATADESADERLFIDGFVAPTRGAIDLRFNTHNTNLEFVESFTKSFMDEVDARGNGMLRLAGTFDSLNLTGQVVADGMVGLRPLGCKYRLQDDTITFVPNEIRFDRAPIRDVYGNLGYVDGSLRHRNLTNLTFDLKIRADRLLAYDYRDFGEDAFYGTVFATGDMSIRGGGGDVRIDIDATPTRGTTFVYNVSNPDAIADQEFIHWRDAATMYAPYSGDDAPAMPAGHETAAAVDELPSDLVINFLIDCTPDATIRLLMDSKTGDYITLHGDGVLRATYYNNGAFTMFGTYTVSDGTYSITIQDLLKKNFSFAEGSTITFGGNPFEANLNLQAVHTVNGVSLSDLSIGNSFANNTIRVNCLMNIGGQPLKPQVTFDLDMPTLSSDEKQMIRSVINSEDEMNQQVVYLLGIGRFYPQRANNATTDNQPSQTSLAMQSLLSGTISSQINTLLGSVIKSNNWSFGANISTGDEGWNNAEYEGLLSGRLLNNRLLINGQFGYRDNANTATPSFIGDFDIRYLLRPNGNLAIKVYNQTNDRYFTRSSLNTQGVGLILKKDFTTLKDLFGK